MSKQVVIFFPGNSVWEARGAPLWRIPLQQHRRCQVLLHLLQVQGSQCLRAAQVFLMQLHELLLFLGCREQAAGCLLPLQGCRCHLLLPPLPAVSLSGNDGISKGDGKLLLLGMGSGSSGGEGGSRLAGVFCRHLGDAGARWAPPLAGVRRQRLRQRLQLGPGRAPGGAGQRAGQRLGPAGTCSGRGAAHSSHAVSAFGSLPGLLPSPTARLTHPQNRCKPPCSSGPTCCGPVKPGAPCRGQADSFRRFKAACSRRRGVAPPNAATAGWLIAAAAAAAAAAAWALLRALSRYFRSWLFTLVRLSPAAQLELIWSRMVLGVAVKGPPAAAGRAATRAGK